jgi:hypothetical protein
MLAKLHGAFWCLWVACRQLTYSDVIVTVVLYGEVCGRNLEQLKKHVYIIESTETI